MEPSPNPPQPSLAPTWHTVGLILGLLLWAALGYRQADLMRSQAAPHRMRLYLVTMLLEWFLFAYVWFGIRRRGMTLGRLTGPKWRGARSLFTNLGIAVGFWIVAAAILFLVSFPLGLAKAGGQQSVQFMLPHNLLELALWMALAATAGICEEAVFRGYLQQQLAAWTRNTTAGVLASAILFGVGHIYQGFRRGVLIAVFGALFGILAAWRRDVKPGMVAHAWQDTLGGIAGYLMSKGYLHAPF